MFTGPEISSMVNRVADKLDAMAVRIDAIPGLSSVICFMNTPILDAALLDLVIFGHIVSTNKAFEPFEEKGLIDEHGSPRTGENLKWALANELAERYENE